ncbi:hypothetical protein ACI2LF_04515 [Kribbella sp. NPDC020789]
MLIAAYARTLREGVTIDQFVEAWLPEGGGKYPAQVEIGVDPANDRRILTVIRVEGSSLEDLQGRMPELIHPDSHARLAEIVESTELEAVYVQQPVDL